MPKRLINNAFKTLREQGFIYTSKKALQWIVDRRRILTYEPVKHLSPCHKDPKFEKGTNESRIAVQIHLFYTELIDTLIAYTNHIPYLFDLYISTNTLEKKKIIEREFAKKSQAHHIVVEVFENKGRDVAPFIMQMTPLIEKYDYLLHLHSKCSFHDDFGNQWRQLLLNSLLYSEGHVSAIMDQFEKNTRLGMVHQRTFYHVKPSLGWKGNKTLSIKYMQRMGLSDELPRNPIFPAGNMFWARTDAIIQAFQCGICMQDFPAEAAQLDGTFAHCIERCWGHIAKQNGFESLRVAVPKGKKMACK